MKVLDFTRETDELANKLIKLGFHYQNTDKMRSEGPHISSQLTSTWVNVMNGVTLQIIHIYDRHYENNVYVKITDDCTNISVTMSVEELMELEQITNSKGTTFPRRNASNENGHNEN